MEALGGGGGTGFFFLLENALKILLGFGRGMSGKGILKGMGISLMFPILESS